MAIIPAEEKVFMVSNSTNTTYSGSAALKAMQQWYTMEDVTNTVRPYQVFTALLTQSGGDDPQDANGITLTVGVTYQIINNSGGADFTIVGAPNNELGTYFIATGTTPNWGDDVADLSWNNGAPVATVLENTIGNVWFIYDGVGNYSVNSSGLFIPNKTVQFINGLVVFEGNIVIINNTDEDFRYLQSISSGGDLTDGLFISAPIEIRVYN
jgi:hypothetical protein